MVSRADLAVSPRVSRTFDEAFSEHHLTVDERKAMVWHLTAFRARKTVEALLSEQIDPQLLDVLRDGKA